MAIFSDVFVDMTRYGTKIPQENYLPEGLYQIIDQGQNEIAGYSNNPDGLFTDVPAIIFGDHTRALKYVDKPLFLGADGVKLLKAKNDNANYKYLYYALCSAKIPDTGYNRHFKWLKEVEIPLPDANTQEKIVAVLDTLNAAITSHKQQLAKLDELVKARFVEMFGNPIVFEKNEHLPQLGKVCILKAGVFVKADDIKQENSAGLYPCFGGNGCRGYVSDYTHDGEFPIIGRQGALCGNVQYARGKFHATEHAVVVTPRAPIDRYWLYYMLKLMDLNRYANGAAQPGLAVQNLEKIHVQIPELVSQKNFSLLACQSEKMRLTIRQGLDKMETLKQAFMQEYFG